MPEHEAPVDVPAFVPWWDKPLVGFDLETTGPDPQSDRIVTAAVARCSREGIDSQTWLADPGVPIPEGASAVHGITTEKAQADGRRRAEVVQEVALALHGALSDGLPLVIVNARFDLTIVARECERLGIVPPWKTAPLLVIDPRVLDTWLDRYRPSYVDPNTGRKLTPEDAEPRGIRSSRTLEGMCAHYGVELTGAHDAAWDAIAGARLAWMMGAKAAPVRRVRNQRDGWELARLRRTWEAVRYDLGNLHDFQCRIALEERDRFAEYKAKMGEHDEAARIRSERGWPVLEPPFTEALA